jgi:hypothetical protein
LYTGITSQNLVNSTAFAILTTALDASESFFGRSKGLLIPVITAQLAAFDPLHLIYLGASGYLFLAG